MMTITSLQSVHLDQHYLIVGLGLSGYSAAGYLLQKGYKVTVQDDRSLPPYLNDLLDKFPQVNVICEALSEEIINKFDCLVVSPGISIRSDLMKNAGKSKRIIGDIELFSEAVNKPVLAITGSNGKSTVTSLLGEIIKADDKKVAVGGNIGVPALELLDENVDFYVLELSSFQLETVESLKPLVATVLNISEDHLDRYDDLQDYCETKKKIFKNAKYCVSNQNDELTWNNVVDNRFSVTSEQCEYSVSKNQQELMVQGDAWIKTSEIIIKGSHNWENCLAAIAMANIAGISKSAIIEGLKTYSGLRHRSQWVAKIDGVNWVNDSKATNPGATKATIDGLGGTIILLAGGQSKGTDMSVVCNSLKQHVKTVLLFGEDANKIQKSWKNCTTIKRVDDLKSGVKVARNIAVEGDTVLLAPACASFDMFNNFSERGEYFMSLVEAMK